MGDISQNPSAVTKALEAEDGGMGVVVAPVIGEWGLIEATAG